MIKALLLILKPGWTWEGIVAARRSPVFVFAVQLVPLLVLGSLCEGYGLVHWGKGQGELAMHLKHFSVGEAVVFEVAQFLLTLIVVLVVTRMIKVLGDTFRSRHTYTQAFCVVAYGLSPLFLLRFVDAFSGVSPWLTWSVGMLLSIGALYHGVPRMMDPDPAHAFGLFLTSALFLTFTTGLERYLTAFYLQGRFPAVEEFMSHLAARLPF
jgi:hypothetical protein